ncbi:MAG: hypothetical protein OHK0021_10610 [Bryobacter sp.]
MRIATFLGLLLGATLGWAQDPKATEAVFETEMGRFRMEFLPEVAPKHVEFFLNKVKGGYYDGSAFHRVFARGLVQGGDPLLKDPKTKRELWGTGGLKLLKSEFSDVKHERGIVSTVSIPGVADSEGAQFFVCLSPQTALDGKYSVFARVTEGIEVVEKISEVPAGEGGVVEKPVRIVKAYLDKKKVEPYLDATVEEMTKTVRMETTLGTLRFALRPDWAPETVRNFLKLAASGWYEGTYFHRIAKGFVVQGGTEGLRSGEGTHPADRWVRNVKGEFQAEVQHQRGTLSMARGDEPDSATTSFFIVLAKSPHLDGKYAAFGTMLEGEEVLAAFEKEEVVGEEPVKKLEVLRIVVE